MINYYELLRIVRESRGIKQEELAKKVGVKQPTLARFEKSGLGISPKKLEGIAEILGVDKRYLVDDSIYPFGNGNFLKLFFTGEAILPGFSGLEPLYTIIRLNQEVAIVPFYCRLEGVAKWRRKSLFEDPAYAVAVKDSHNNIFLLRKKKNTEYVLLEGDLKSPLLRMYEISKKEQRPISLKLATADISMELKNKISSDWEKVTKKDIETVLLGNRVYEELRDHRSEIADPLEKHGITSVSDDQAAIIAKLLKLEKADYHEVASLIEKKGQHLSS